MPPVEVVVVLTDQTHGLDSAALRTLVELRLRQNSIPVLQDGDAATYPRVGAFLEVHVMWNTRNTQRIFAYQLMFMERAKLTRNQRVTLGEVWGSDLRLGFVGGSLDFPQEMKENFTNMVDRFVNDYLAANPRRN
jgi:hypothetical protein